VSEIKTLVRSTYDLQKIRIQMGNRITGQFKAKLGQSPGESEDELSEDAQDILRLLRQSYDRITDGIVMPERQFHKIKFVGDGIIDTTTELALVAQYVELAGIEMRQFARFEKLLDNYPIYTEFLKGVRGCGPAMSGVIISEIDIHKAKYPSSIWQYAGLDVKTDGRGASKRSEHLVDREYTARDGTQKTKKSITYNPFIRTKLLGVLAPSFIKQGERSPYRLIYDAYKHRLENHPKWTDTTKGHRHAAAMRYCVKMFLIDLYKAWRPLEGLPVYPSYAEAKLGLYHGAEIDRHDQPSVRPPDRDGEGAVATA